MYWPLVAQGHEGAVFLLINLSRASSLLKFVGLLFMFGSFNEYESDKGAGGRNAVAREPSSLAKSRAIALVLLFFWIVGLLQLYLATLNERHDRRSGAWRPAQDFGSLSTRPWTAMPEIKLKADPRHIKQRNLPSRPAGGMPEIKLKADPPQDEKSATDATSDGTIMGGKDASSAEDEVSERAEAGSDEEWCRRMHSTAMVKPGQSWGTLSEAAIEQWKIRRCDKFFCKPNHMEAQGMYNCEPLHMPVTTS